MGRPIKDKYFGKQNTGGVGGEGVSAVTTSNVATSYATATVDLVFTAPQLAGGIRAAGTVSFAAGTVSTITLTNAGAGYTSAPTVTANASTTGTTATFLATLTASTTNVIAASAWIPTVNGGASAKVADIVKQESSRKYLVSTADGTGVCRLASAAVAAAGEMTISAEDSGGGTYYVTKLTARKAVLTRSGAGPWEFSTDSTAKWSLSAAVANTTVLITSN